MIVITGVFMVFYLSGVFCKGFKRTNAVVRWAFITILVGLFGKLTQWAMFPFAWLLRGIKLNPFWFWLDDSRYFSKRIYADDYYAYLKLHGKDKETFWIAYKWHLRNDVWNLKSLFKPKTKSMWEGNNYFDTMDIVTDNLHKEDLEYTKYKQNGIWEIFAGLKYIGEGDPWQINQGDIIARDYSIVGSGFVWYTIGRWTSFRYSVCKRVDYGFWKGWRTIKLGTNSKRFVFTIKHQKDKEWQ